MRILMTTDTVGGVWTYAVELADALGARGVDVALATMGAALRPDQESQLRRVRIRECHVSELALEWMDDPWDDVARAGDWLLRLADDVHPDLVHLNGYAHAALPWDAPTLVVAHSDVLSWHEAVRGRPAGPEWRRYREAVAAGLAAADLLVAPTRALLAELERLYELPCETRVIPNGSAARPPERPKEPFVLSAGRLWDEAKNAAALVRVAPKLAWPVTLAGQAGVRPGPGPVPEGSRNGHVRLLGRLGRPELDDVLARAAIFAEPALYEPFGLAALEAGLAGCALVLGDITSLREVWDDAALFVDPRDDAALEAALQALIADEALRAERGRAARARARTFTLRRTVDAYLEAYGLLTRDEAAAA